MSRPTIRISPCVYGLCGYPPVTICLHTTLLSMFLSLPPDSVVPDSPASKASMAATEAAQISHPAVLSVLSVGCLSFLVLDQTIRPLALLPQLGFIQSACHKADIPLSESHHDSFRCMKRNLTHVFLRVTFLSRLFSLCRSVYSRRFFCFRLSSQHNLFISCQDEC